MTLFNFEGQIIGTTTKVYKTYRPESNYVEQNADEWWEAVCQGTQQLTNECNIAPEEIAAIGVAGHSWTCLPLDEKGTPLHNAMIWLDRRAIKQAQWLKDNLGEERLIYMSGNPVDAAYLVPKMLWIREEKPEIYQKANKFLQSNAYIVFKLTDRYSQDYSQGYGFHFFNISKGCWDEKVADELNISLDLMAPLFHCHEVVGTVTNQASENTGVSAGTPVVAGGLDAATCTLGAGVIHPGQTQEQGGQAGGMSILVDKPLIHPKLILGYHVLPDKWLLQGGTVGGAGTLRWFNEQLGKFEQWIGAEKEFSPFELMSQEAGEIEPGSDGLVFLPYMAGERSPIWNSKARGVLFGLSYDKTRAHIIRSIMEGVGYSLLHNLKTAEEIDAQAEELISVGGASNSQVWTQIKSDITGKTIHVPFSDHATTLGAVILAGVGVGVYEDFEDAVEKTVRIQRIHTPDEKNHAVYQGYYELYLELYEKIKVCYETLDELVEEGL